MKRFQYVAWLRDHNMSPDDQDYEWCACIFIEANSLNEAMEWGDDLAKSYCKKMAGLEFLRSYIDHEMWEKAQHVPVITAGQLATDEEIGW